MTDIISSNDHKPDAASSTVSSDETKTQACKPLNPASVTFVVEGESFLIPKSILQHHKGSFEGLVKFDNESNESVVLDDVADDFRAFHNAVYNPFDSCLGIPYAGPGEVAELIKVLHVCNKYGVTDWEKRARSLIHATMYLPQRAWVSDGMTTLRILEIGLETKHPDLIERGRKLVIEDMGAQVKINPFHVLDLGEVHGFPDLKAHALYQIMLGKDLTSRVSGLSGGQLQNVMRGALACYQLWDDFRAKCERWVPSADPNPFSFFSKDFEVGFIPRPSQGGIACTAEDSLKIPISSVRPNDPQIPAPSSNGSTNSTTLYLGTGQTFTIKVARSNDIRAIFNAILGVPDLPRQFYHLVQSELIQFDRNIETLFSPMPPPRPQTARRRGRFKRDEAQTE